jgi:hypothetical protein
MPFTGKQLNTYGPRPQRMFIMDVSRSGLPVTVLHLFEDSTATMRVRLLSLVPIVDAAGTEMDRGETVTVFNDLVVLAPGAIPDAPVQWRAVDSRLQGEVLQRTARSDILLPAEGVGAASVAFAADEDVDGGVRNAEQPGLSVVRVSPPRRPPQRRPAG